MSGVSASSAGTKPPEYRPQAASVALTLKAAGRTDVGKRRQHNEDVVLVREDLGLFVVADGAGGHNAGEVASALSCRSIENYFGATIRATHDLPEFDRLGVPNGARRLSRAVHKANRDVVEISRTSPAHRGMGTTVVAACFSPRSGLVHVANVGDSRCYRLRGGHFEQLTQDHSLLTDALEQRPDLEEEVLARLPRNIVTRVLGFEDQVRVSIRSHGVSAGDRYLLCSDGLSGPVPGPEIADVLSWAETPAAIAEQLVARANLRGGPDNIAALVVEFKETSAAQPNSGAPALVEHESVATDVTSDPELLILGIQDLDVAELMSASDDLLKAIEGLLGKR